MEGQPRKKKHYINFVNVCVCKSKIDSDDATLARKGAALLYYQRQIMFSIQSQSQPEPATCKVMPSLNWWTFAFLVVNILALALCIILIYLFTCLVRAQRPE